MNISEEEILREIPEKVFVKIIDEKGLSLVSLSILLIFKTDYKNDFGYILSRKNVQNSFFVLNKAEIIKKAEENANLFIMDYGTIEYCFVSRIQVKLRNTSEIRRAIKNYYEYSAIKPDLFYPGYLDDLQYNLEETKKLEESGKLKNLRIECWSEPKGIVTFELLPL